MRKISLSCDISRTIQLMVYEIIGVAFSRYREAEGVIYNDNLRERERKRERERDRLQSHEVCFVLL